MGRGTAAAGGGGGVLPLGTKPHDAVRDSGWVGEDIFRGDTQHPYPLRLEPLIAQIISLGPIAHVVAHTIDLDPELQIEHVEIENISTDRVLTPEFDVARLLSKDLP